MSSVNGTASGVSMRLSQNRFQELKAFRSGQLEDFCKTLHVSDSIKSAGPSNVPATQQRGPRNEKGNALATRHRSGPRPRQWLVSRRPCRRVLRAIRFAPVHRGVRLPLNQEAPNALRYPNAPISPSTGAEPPTPVASATNTCGNDGVSGERSCRSNPTSSGC
jgi:hypothetical protein